MTNNHQKVRSTCLVHEFFFTDIFNNITHGPRAVILKKYIFVAASVLYGRGYLLLLSWSQETSKKPIITLLVTMLMCSAIVSYLLEYTYT